MWGSGLRMGGSGAQSFRHPQRPISIFVENQVSLPLHGGGPWPKVADTPHCQPEGGSHVPRTFIKISRKHLQISDSKKNVGKIVEIFDPLPRPPCRPSPPREGHPPSGWQWGVSAALGRGPPPCRGRETWFCAKNEMGRWGCLTPWAPDPPIRSPDPRIRSPDPRIRSPGPLFAPQA